MDARREAPRRAAGCSERCDLPARSLRAVWARGLAAQLPTALWWIAGLTIYAAWTTGVARSTEDSLQEIAGRCAASGQPGPRQPRCDNDAGFLAAILFLYLPLLLVVYAMIEAGAWARDLDSGSMELVLVTPQPRWRVMLQRFGALILLLVGAPVFIELVVLLSGRVAGLSLDAGYVTAAMLGIFPLELVTASIVFLLAGRTAATIGTGVVGALVAFSFMVSLLYTVLNMPAWLADLSIFRQYGSPITDGPRWGSSLAITGLAAVVLTVAVIGFTRADVQRVQ